MATRAPREPERPVSQRAESTFQPSRRSPGLDVTLERQRLVLEVIGPRSRFAIRERKRRAYPLNTG